MPVNVSSPPVSTVSVFGWIVIQQSVDDQPFDWQLPWDSYKNGFGSPDSNFWLGLETVHQLTYSGSYRIRFEVQQRSTGLWYSAEYWTFVIDDEATYPYRIHVNG
jgi:ficolin